VRRKLATLAAIGLLTAGLGSAAVTPAFATVPGGPCLQPNQNISLSSVPSYDEVVATLDRIEHASQGLIAVKSAGQSGEGRELLYATVGSGPTAFWLQARIHGNEIHSTEAVLQVLDYLASGAPEAQTIRQNLTVVVIPMYNPDGASGADTNEGRDLLRSPLCRPKEQRSAGESLPDSYFGSALGGCGWFPRVARRVGLSIPAIRHPGSVRPGVT
jgi:Zinc carboxypeptidase